MRLSVKDAIPTIYKGVQMKSRFEANVAALLDDIGMRWLYEPKSFLLGKGLRKVHYQPDFYCPDVGLWVETRGYRTPKGETQIKLFAEMLSGNTGHGAMGTMGVDCERWEPDDGNPLQPPINSMIVLGPDARTWHFCPVYDRTDEISLYLCLECDRRFITPADGANSCSYCHSSVTVGCGAIELLRGVAVVGFQDADDVRRLACAVASARLALSLAREKGGLDHGIPKRILELNHENEDSLIDAAVKDLTSFGEGR